MTANEQAEVDEDSPQENIDKCELVSEPSGSSVSKLLLLASHATKSECENYWWKHLTIDPALACSTSGKGCKRKAKAPRNPRRCKAARVEQDLCDALSSLFIEKRVVSEAVQANVLSVSEITLSLGALSLCSCALPSCLSCAASDLGQLVEAMDVSDVSSHTHHMESLNLPSSIKTNVSFVKECPDEMSRPGGQSRGNHSDCAQSSPSVLAKSSLSVLAQPSINAHDLTPALELGPALKIGRFTVRVALNFNPSHDNPQCPADAALDHSKPGSAPISGTHSVFSKFFSSAASKPIHKNLTKKLKRKKPSKQRSALGDNSPLSRPANQRGIEQYLKQETQPMGDGVAGQALL